ncbi:MAG: hypothetical protein R3185_07055 [Candidatus Thermoplasmatota archaeon]|nr:hypothetical protein [Candidatus Thermoplasmatota archaeon]
MSEEPEMRPMWTEPRTVALVMVIFLLIIGLPAGLYYWTGQEDVARGLVLAFLAMVVVTGYALRVASREARKDLEDER